MRTALLALVLVAAPALADVPGWMRQAWPETDFSRISIDPDEVFSGGPPRDGIPAITDPAFIDVSAEARIGEREPVMWLDVGGDVRAYPIRYLMWHEIANDVIGGVPVAVTFCPLCNSAIAFDRRLEGRTLEFGVSGLLRNSDMIMYDRATFSWWQQFTGEAIAGALTGAELAVLPSQMESWGAFRAAHPGARVMDEPRGGARAYGRNPYGGYDTGSWPFLYRGEAPPHGVPPLARVLRVGDRAWPLTRISGARDLTEGGVRIRWREGQASALDASTVGAGREVGDVSVVDAATGKPVVHEVVFAFAFHAFHPDGRWMLGD